MSGEETITVADVSAGAGGSDSTEPGETVELPVVDLLTGRGFITGKSGSGKSNTASVVIERLLDGGYPVLIVDADGEYYGLKEEYELLHAGADEECDIQVEPEHAEKLAALALEQNVPIVLDVSGYLEEDTASELILQVTRHLFTKEKKMKKPFLMLVEECHEYIPEGGGMDRTGEMLIKVGKRGRKHGLGVVGISQRPADVKKDFITQCDWLVWHRLTWENDTKVVGRLLGSEYATAVEDLDDGEGFLMTDWAEDLRRVQFRRKATFDAGATPGLEDFERPDLKSVSGDLVSDLQEITDQRERRESEMADLRQELDRKRQRITELEAELEDARDLSRMADEFAQAMLSSASASYRGGQADRREYEREDAPPEPGRTEPTESGVTDDGESQGSEDADADANEPDGGEDDRPEDPFEAFLGDAEPGPTDGTPETVASTLRERVESLTAEERAMLGVYEKRRTSTPREAYDGEDRELAYATHRALRRQGFVQHVSGGRYVYALPALLRGMCGDSFSEGELSAALATVEAAIENPELEV